MLVAVFINEEIRVMHYMNKKRYALIIYLRYHIHISQRWNLNVNNEYWMTYDFIHSLILF